MNPKRTSVWSTKDGKLLKDLAGTTRYASAGAINPDDPAIGFSDDTVYKIDLATGTSRPVWSLGKSYSPGAIFPAAADARSRIFNRDGTTFVFTTGSAASSTDVHCTILKDGVWRSAAHVGTVRKPKDNRGNETIYSHPISQGHEGHLYSWADANGDTLVQPDEMRFSTLQFDGQPAKTRSFYWGQLPDAEGTVVFLVEFRRRTRRGLRPQWQPRRKRSVHARRAVHPGALQGCARWL
jgi:hypothetical protein